MPGASLERAESVVAVLGAALAAQLVASRVPSERRIEYVQPAAHHPGLHDHHVLAAAQPAAGAGASDFETPSLRLHIPIVPRAAVDTPAPVTRVTGAS